MTDDEGKIITDDDWKSKAQAEKEALAEQAPDAAEAELPEPSFLGVVEEYAVRAMLSLGQFPHPATGQLEIDLRVARHTIDLLGIIEKKTKGNLSADETEMLADALKNLRLAYVQVEKAVNEQVAKLGERDVADGGATGDDGASPGPKLIVD